MVHLQDHLIPEEGDEVVIGVLANTLWADNGQPAVDAIRDGFENTTVDKETSLMFYEGEIIDDEGNEVVVGNFESTLYLRRSRSSLMKIQVRSLKVFKV